MKALISLICFLVAAHCGGQGSIQSELTRKSLTDASRPTKQRLSSQEMRWCPSIEAGRQQSGGFGLGMRAFLLERIAAGLKKCDPSQALPTLLDSFATTLAIPDSESEIRQELQIGTLTDLLAISRQKVEQLLPQADPVARAHIRRNLISRAIDTKQFARALDMLIQSAFSNEEFPYDEAGRLILAYPPQRSAEKQTLFGSAIRKYRMGHVPCTGCDDLSSLIIHTWREVPPALALEGIYTVLDYRNDSSDTRAEYEQEYHLLQLLPVLRTLDNAKAEDLIQSSAPRIRQRAQAQAGMGVSEEQSLQDDQGLSQTTPATLPIIVRTREMTKLYNTRIQELGKMAEDNPRQAIAASAALPTFVETPRSQAIKLSAHVSTGALAPRAQALLAVARSAVNKNVSAARDALDEMLRALEDLPSSYKIPYCVQGIILAGGIGEINLTQKFLKEGMRETDNLRSQDTDSRDPNLALKAWWPSVTAGSELLISAASYIGPQAVLAEVNAIDDPELRVLYTVTLANRQLGVPERSVTMVRKKSGRGNWSSTMEPPASHNAAK